MKRPAPRCCNDQGLEESVSVILMVILVIAVAAIIASIVFGLAIFFPKSAYIVVQTEAKNVTPDNWYLSVSHMNGDAAYLNHTLTTNNGMPVDFQFTNSTIGTVIPKPDPADGPETWKPGDTLFVYRNQSGYVWVTKNETLARNGIGLPQGVWRFDVVDKTDDVLVYTTSVGVGVAEPTTIPTTTPNTSVTTTVVTTATPIPQDGSITGTVTNCNTGQGLAGFLMRLYYRNGTFIKSTTTNSAGVYSFTSLVYSPSTDYYVIEIPASGWVTTKSNCNPDSGSAQSNNLPLTPGHKSDTANFYNVPV